MKVLLVPALVLIALALASCGDDEDTTVTETEPVATAPNPEDESSPAETEAAPEPAPKGDLERSAKVEIVNFLYEPDPVRVETGGKVTWQNMDAAPHTATADDGSFDTETLEEGKLKSESFKKAGTYTYFCEIHPDMRGTVEVVDTE